AVVVDSDDEPLGSRSWGRDASGSQKRRCVLAPIEAKQEGDEGAECDQADPELASAAPEPGPVPRRPGRPPGERPAANSRQSEPSPEELEGIVQSIRFLPPAERRAAVAALPDVTRRCLSSHLKDESGGSRLGLLLAHLPDLLPAATIQQRRELLDGVRWLQATHATILAAPDMAAVCAKLRE
ncbi:unnamed protein product, partial [Polarella glacialis]